MLKKFLLFLFFFLLLPVVGRAAAVLPQIRGELFACYEVSGCAVPGIYTVKLNDLGQPDSNGNHFFTIRTGTMEGRSFTQVLSWSSSVDIACVVLSDGATFHIYEYEELTRNDSDLIGPVNQHKKSSKLRYVFFLPQGARPVGVPSVVAPPTPWPSPTLCPPLPSYVAHIPPGWYYYGRAILFLGGLATINCFAQLICLTFVLRKLREENKSLGKY